MLQLSSGQKFSPDNYCSISIKMSAKLFSKLKLGSDNLLQIDNWQLSSYIASRQVMCDIILLFVLPFTWLGSLKERRGWGGKKLDVDRVAKHKIVFSHSNLTQANVAQPSTVSGGISSFNLCNSKLIVLYSLIPV